MFYPSFYFDPTYILIIIGVIICSIASMRVKSTFSKYSGMRNHMGLTGAQAAERVLHGAGIYDVRIERVAGNLTDHYDPRNKVLRLSDATYGQCSVAAVGVAAHECGHAIQHARGYAPLSVSEARLFRWQILDHDCLATDCVRSVYQQPVFSTAYQYRNLGIFAGSIVSTCDFAGGI